jgi:hypothetical protein
LSPPPPHHHPLSPLSTPLGVRHWSSFQRATTGGTEGEQEQEQEQREQEQEQKEKEKEKERQQEEEEEEEEEEEKEKEICESEERERREKEEKESREQEERARREKERVEQENRASEEEARQEKEEKERQEKEQNEREKLDKEFFARRAKERKEHDDHERARLHASPLRAPTSVHNVTVQLQQYRQACGGEQPRTNAAIHLRKQSLTQINQRRDFFTPQSRRFHSRSQFPRPSFDVRTRSDSAQSQGEVASWSSGSSNSPLLEPRLGSQLTQSSDQLASQLSNDSISNITNNTSLSVVMAECRSLHERTISKLSQLSTEKNRSGEARRKLLDINSILSKHFNEPCIEAETEQRIFNLINGLTENTAVKTFKVYQNVVRVL